MNLKSMSEQEIIQIFVLFFVNSILSFLNIFFKGGGCPYGIVTNVVS